MGQIMCFRVRSGAVGGARKGGFGFLTEAFSPGACVAGVARRHDVSTALIYTGRRKLREPVAEPGFAEAVVAMMSHGVV